MEVELFEKLLPIGHEPVSGYRPSLNDSAETQSLNFRLTLLIGLSAECEELICYETPVQHDRLDSRSAFGEVLTGCMS
jgi:hypothetical protein